MSEKPPKPPPQSEDEKYLHNPLVQMATQFPAGQRNPAKTEIAAAMGMTAAEFEMLLDDYREPEQG